MRRLLATYSKDWLHELAVVGSARACYAGLERYYDAGADLVAAYAVPVGPDPAASMRATIEALHPEQA